MTKKIVFGFRQNSSFLFHVHPKSFVSTTQTAENFLKSKKGLFFKWSHAWKQALAKEMKGQQSSSYGNYNTFSPLFTIKVSIFAELPCIVGRRWRKLLTARLSYLLRLLLLLKKYGRAVLKSSTFKKVAKSCCLLERHNNASFKVAKK